MTRIISGAILSHSFHANDALTWLTDDYQAANDYPDGQIRFMLGTWEKRVFDRGGEMMENPAFNRIENMGGV
jgi:hypothetical protein